ncbi:unnamed protein product [Pedinophyceae sp. YPF-701]|nr:unnamed protein product [Pedinophyceae sp. YPF-701]
MAAEMSEVMSGEEVEMSEEVSGTVYSDMGVDRVIDLFTSELSSELRDRHAAAIRRLCRSYPEGIAIRDLPKVDHLMDITIRLVVEEGDEELGEPLCAMLQALSLPFLKKSATDEFRGFTAISAIFTRISECLRTSMPREVVLSAAAMLQAHASAYGASRSWAGRLTDTGPEAEKNADMRVFLQNQRLLGKSGTVEAAVLFLSQLLSEDSDDPDRDDIVLAFVDLLVLFSRSPDNAEILADAGLLETIPLLLEPSISCRWLPQAVDLMWNVLDAHPEAARALSEEPARELATAIHGVLQHAAEHGYRLQDKEARNDLVAVMWMLAAGWEFSRALRDVKCLMLLLDVVVCPEFNAAPSAAFEKNMLSHDTEDAQLKRLAWSVVTRVCTSSSSGSEPDQGALDQAIGTGFLQVQLMYLDTDPDLELRARWTAAQFHGLRSQVLSTLWSLAAPCEEQLSDMGLVPALINFIHSADDTESLAKAMSVLERTAQRPRYWDELVREGAVALSLSIFDSTHAEGRSGEIRENALLTICCLCQSRPECVAQFRRAGGIPAIRAELVRLRGLDHTLPSPFAAVVLQTVWVCISHCRKNLARFLAADGMDALLDLLEPIHEYLRPLLLSALTDMLANPRSHQFLHDWRSSKDGESAVHHVIALWRQEEAARGIGAGSTLSNLERPLAGTGKRVAWIPRSTVAQAVRDKHKAEQVETFARACTSDGLLVKVYCFLDALGWDSMDYLPHEDKVTLCLIQGYVKLTQGDLWQDIVESFRESGFRPTSPDQARLDMAVETVHECTRDLAGTQIELQQSRYDVAAEGEQASYTRMITQREMDAEARTYRRDKTRLSMKERQALKARKEHMMRTSLRPDLGSHQLDMPFEAAPVAPAIAGDARFGAYDSDEPQVEYTQRSEHSDWQTGSMSATGGTRRDAQIPEDDDEGSDEDAAELRSGVGSQVSSRAASRPTSVGTSVAPQPPLPRPVAGQVGAL